MIVCVFKFFNEKILDFTVLEFKRAFTLRHGRVMPVCLPSLEYTEGTNVLVSGWGRLRERK